MEPLLPAVILLAVVAAIEGRELYLTADSRCGLFYFLGSQTVLGFLPLGATGAVTTNLQARDNAVSGAIPTGGSFPYSSGHVNTAYVRYLFHCSTSACIKGHQRGAPAIFS